MGRKKMKKTIDEENKKKSLLKLAKNIKDEEIYKYIKLLVEDGKYQIGRDGSAKFYLKEFCELLAEYHMADNSNALSSYIRVNYFEKKKIKGLKLIKSGTQWLIQIDGNADDYIL